MSKSEKEGYKTPRLPKRKREEDQNTPTTASKLAKFAVSKQGLYGILLYDYYLQYDDNKGNFYNIFLKPLKLISL